MKTSLSVKSDFNKTLRTVLIFLLALVLIASAVLSVRLGEWVLSGRGDRISLSGGGAGSILRVFHSTQRLRNLGVGLSDENYNIHDDHTVWQTETKVDIFSAKHYSANGLTVNSDNGDKVIAPGTTGTYRFTVENTNQLPMYYELTFESWQEGFRFNLPMQARVYNEENEYLLGSPAAWPDITELNNAADQRTLEAGESMTYTLEWRWPFEQASGDWLDTAFGDQAAFYDMINADGIELGIRIMTTAEIEEPEEVLPEPEELPGDETPLADTGAAWALVNLISTILASGIGVYETVVFLKKHKDDAELSEEQNTKLKKRRRNKIWDVLPAVASIVTFILTEDMTLPMTWVDKWTILMLAYLAVSVGVGCFTRLKKKKEEVEESLPVS